MSKFPVALQVYSVRDAAEKDFAETMRSVKAMGYDGVELAGTYDMTIPQAKQILDQAGLELVSAHVAMDLLENDEILDAYQATGVRYVAIPWQEGPKTQQELDAVISRIQKIGQRCAERGLQLLYHNHDFEFIKIGGAYVLDTLYSSIAPELLATELDVCWVRVGGEAPEDYLAKYAHRAPVVHIKDYTGEKSENMYALIGKEETQAKPSTFAFRPVGYGKQDIPTILEAAENAGSSWLIVEQDEPGMGKTAMECAKMSIDYLHTLF